MLVEVGDMIYWLDGAGETDIGWVVSVERRSPLGYSELENLIHIRWLFKEERKKRIWEQTIKENSFITLIKGGQHG